MGLGQVSIEEKVKTEAEKRGNDPGDDQFITMPQDFRLMHKTIQSMRRCEAAAKGQQTHMQFTGILFEWQARVSMLQSGHPQINAA